MHASTDEAQQFASRKHKLTKGIIYRKAYTGDTRARRRLWSVSCELSLNRFLFNSLRSKEHLRFHLHTWKTSICVCVKALLSDKERFILHWRKSSLTSTPTSLTSRMNCSLASNMCWPQLFFLSPPPPLTGTWKDQTIQEMLKNRLQLFYQSVQSRAVWNEPRRNRTHWWQSMEEAGGAFKNTHAIMEGSFSYLPGLKRRLSSSFTHICTLGCVLELILKWV